ncbi:MAG: TetR/AcrR family transcriptional regulator [Lactobacillaceae bacterium]
MKYTSAKGHSVGVKRTLMAFEDAMFNLLGKQTFEKVTVSEICAQAMYPRATFYNYFDDKYDLLEYCWNSISQNIHLDQINSKHMKLSLFEVFDQVYDLFSSYQDLLLKIIKHNPLNSRLVQNFINHFSKILEKVLNNTIDKQKNIVPIELLAQQYSNSAVIILKWIFLEGHQTTLNQAHIYLTVLVGDSALPD